jgi:hypothetical protein
MYAWHSPEREKRKCRDWHYQEKEIDNDMWSLALSGEIESLI